MVSLGDCSSLRYAIAATKDCEEMLPYAHRVIERIPEGLRRIRISRLIALAMEFVNEEKISPFYRGSRCPRSQWIPIHRIA